MGATREYRQRVRSNCFSSLCSLNVLWPFDGYQTCYTLADFRDCFMGHKVKVKLLIFISTLSVQYVMNHFLIITKLGTLVATREWIIHCNNISATLLNFAPRGQLCFSNIFCFKTVFKWINILDTGDYLMVMLPGHFVHLLNVGIEFEPCQHILLHGK